MRLQSNIPVIMLTARGEDVDRIVGLEMGADDYLPKPFNPRELLVRIKAVKRHIINRNEPRLESISPETLGVLQAGDVCLDLDTYRVTLNNQPVSLTTVEFTLLKKLVSQAGNVIRREERAQKPLGRQLNLFDRSIDVHVSKTDYGKPGFGGACPPLNDKPHAYIFTVFALDVAKLDLDANASPALVGFMLNAHTIAKSSLIAYYSR